LRGSVEIMTNDGQQLEKEPPAGYVAPRVLCWIDPKGVEHAGTEVLTGPEGADGRWTVEVELRDEMMRIDLTPEIA
jgi:hypothetical protein